MADSGMAADTMALWVPPPPWRARYIAPVTPAEHVAAARLRASMVADCARRQAKDGPRVGREP